MVGVGRILRVSGSPLRAEARGPGLAREDGRVAAEKSGGGGEEWNRGMWRVRGMEEERRGALDERCGRRERGRNTGRDTRVRLGFLRQFFDVSFLSQVVIWPECGC